MELLKNLTIPIMLLSNMVMFSSHALADDKQLSNDSKLIIEKIDNHMKFPNDSKLVMGELDNGMKYIVYPHENPKGQINLWLQVHSGSLAEEDDQQGVAHFVEHMLFNGTRDYPGNQVIEIFEKMGLKFGRDVNAYTTYHETVYQVNMANDNLENIQQVMNIFYNWASLATFDANEVEAERGVIIEEWRSHQGIKWRNNQQRRPLLLAGTRHLEREPIGLTEIINTVSPQRVQDYYTKWYQPQNMTFIITGDLGDLQPVDLIKEKLSNLKQTQPIVKETYQTKANEKATFNIIWDEENVANSFAVIYRQPRIFVRTQEDFTVNAKQSLLTQLFNQRMYDMLQDGQLSDISSARAIAMGMADDYQAFHFRVQAKQDNLQDAVNGLLRELQRIDNFGFTQEELSRVQKTQLAYLENAAGNPESRDAKMLTGRIAYSAFYDVPFISPQTRYEATQQAYSQITLAQINDEWKKLRSNPDHIYEQLVTTAVKEQAYTPEQILAFVEQAKELALTAYQPVVVTQELLSKKPQAGKVIKQSKLTDTITELQLENGAKVIIRPTNFNDSNVYFTAIGNKGFLSFTDLKDYHVAKFASKVVNLSGLGELSASALKDWNATNFTNINTMVQGRNTFISISGNNKKLEPMFQLMHQRFHADKASDEIWRIVKQSQENELKALAVQPKNQFNQQVYSTRFADERTNPITQEILDTVTTDYLLQLDQRLFADPSAFTFLIVGNITVDDVKTLTEQYLASLTPNQEKVLAGSIDLVRNTQPIDVVLNIETEPFAQVVEFWNYPLAKELITEQMRQELAAFNFAIARDLRIQIRENSSGAYSVGSIAMVSPITGELDYRLSFSCDPERYEELLSKAQAAVVNRIKTGITADELAEYKKMQLRMVDVQKNNNSQLSRLLQSSYIIYNDPTIYRDVQAVIEGLTVENINQTGQQLLQHDSYKFKAVLLPK